LLADTLKNLIRVYEHALEADKCDDLLRFFELFKHKHIVNGAKEYEYLEGCQWTELDLYPITDQAFHDFMTGMMLEYKARYEKDCSISPPLPEPAGIYGLRMKRYDCSGKEQFVPHMDAYGPASRRFLVFLWYLNDVAEGGETEFVDLDIRVKPRKGTLLMFPPYWMYRHAGRPPVSNPKYIINTFHMW